MNSEVTWVLISSGSHVQSQIILDLDYLLDYLSVYDNFSWVPNKWGVLMRGLGGDIR